MNGVNFAPVQIATLAIKTKGFLATFYVACNKNAAILLSAFYTIYPAFEIASFMNIRILSSEVVDTVIVCQVDMRYRNYLPPRC